MSVRPGGLRARGAWSRYAGPGLESQERRRRQSRRGAQEGSARGYEPIRNQQRGRGLTMTRDQYVSGEYLAKNPTWGSEDSEWKANQIHRLLEDNSLHPKVICEVGCGAGSILRHLHDTLDPAVELVGYDISPQAIELASPKATSRLRFVQRDIRDESPDYFDVILLMDVIEHVPDYLGLLEDVRAKSDYTVLHIPLDMCALTVLRPHSLVATHDTLGHIHSFVRDTAFCMLTDVGYEIVDWRYTTIVDMTHRPPGSRQLRLLNASRRLIDRFSPELSARVLGGYSLLVLAR
jgi:SAM-dependent methyltransferase